MRRSIAARSASAAVREIFQHPDPRVTVLKLDVTSASQIQQAAREVNALDVLINNAGVALYDDLSNPDALEQQVAVNHYGPFQMIRAFLTQLRQSKGTIVNNVRWSPWLPYPSCRAIQSPRRPRSA
jgi:NAD(P)-dependent dehydrogenase (short-subunit alcohol dehydrogenase family)